MAKRTILALFFFAALIGTAFAAHAWTHYFSHNLHYGETGGDVLFLQEYLAEQGYFHYPTTTDYFGPITFGAVKAWQAANSIPSTGFFGPISRAFANATDTPSVSASTSAATSTDDQSATSTTTVSSCWIPGACGKNVGNGVGVADPSNAPDPITISISPASTSIFSDATTTFVATVLNAATSTVTWSASLGTINASGVYTPPMLVGTSTVTDTITATSQADPTKSASITITVSSGLTGYWPLDEGTGMTALDATANGLNGTWSGTRSSASGTYYSSIAAAGPYSGYFDGSDDYIDMGSSTPFNAQSVTLSAWVYPTAFSGQNIIMGKEFQYKDTIDAGQFTILSTCYGGGGWDIDQHVASATLDEWQYVTFVQNTSSSIDQFYLNGSLVYSTSTCGAVNVFTDNDFEVGAYDGAMAPFQGMIDDARFYTRALSATQIQSLYNANTPGRSMSITPATTTLLSGATTTFTPTFFNDPGDVATWSASTGTINPMSGAYTAPTVYTTTTATIYAQSQIISAVSSTAAVTISPRPITISISPTSTSLLANATTSFIATVSNAPTSSVTWSAAYGSINSSGVYTAPSSTASSTITDTITATSVADNTKIATATVTVTPGLLGWWPTREGSGSVAYDVSGNGNNATWYGTPSGSSGYYQSYNSTYAGIFDGGDNYLSTSVSWPTSGSLSLWADPAGIASWKSPAGWKYAPSSGGYILIDEGSSGNWRAVFNSSGLAEVDIQSTSSIPTNAWSHLVMTWNKIGATTTIALYVNDTLQGSTTTVQNATSSIGSFYYGTAGQAVNNDFNGFIDDVRVYDRALTPSEIQGIYSAEESANTVPPSDAFYAFSGGRALALKPGLYRLDLAMSTPWIDPAA